MHIRILAHTCIGHRSEPISGTSAEPPVEEDYEYDYIVDPPLHAARVNQSERAEGPSIPLSANISYNVVI